jgi:hypothetical protein
MHRVIVGDKMAEASLISSLGTQPPIQCLPLSFAAPLADARAATLTEFLHKSPTCTLGL